MKFHNTEEVIGIIEQRKNRGYGLDHFKAYMESIGNPHQSLKTIHIAGTNGKGSTTNDIRSILQEAGYKVGSFTSPYLITHLDRIRMNNEFIPSEIFLDIANRYYDSWIKWDLSMFEIDMCIASIYFSEAKTDFCVFETGLGGRLDATNILRPLISVISNIGMDHMEFLGDTKEKIAKEKAGIIKDDTCVITAEETASCLGVFEETAHDHHTDCIRIQNIMNIEETEDGLCFDYGQYKALRLTGKALYQCKNAALAVETIDYLKHKNIIQVSENDIRQGLKKAVWQGRFEMIYKDPLIIIDGAHNADGIHALCENIKKMKQVIVIFSVLKDKNYEQMIEELQKVSEEIIIVPFMNERALDISCIKDHPYISFMDSYMQAIHYAIKKKQPIVITGSLYFISDVRKYLIKEGFGA